MKHSSSKDGSKVILSGFKIELSETKIATAWGGVSPGVTLVWRDTCAAGSNFDYAMLQALLRQAYDKKMLQKQLSAEGLKTQALVLVIQHLNRALEGAQAEACSLRAANLDLHNQFEDRDAEVSDLRLTMEELRSSLASEVKDKVAFLLMHHSLTLTLVLPAFRVD